MFVFTILSAWENSNRRSVTFSRYSLATSALDIVCVPIPEDVALPDRAFKKPDATCDVNPDLDALPSLETIVPIPTLFDILLEFFGLESKQTRNTFN